MDSFEFMSPTKFILDKDADQLCGQEVKKISDQVLFAHYGDDYMYKSGLHARIIKALEAAQVTYYELPGVRTESRGRPCPGGCSAL